MSGIKGLIYILLASLLIFTSVVAALEWGDILRLRAFAEETERELALRAAGLLRESITASEITDEYALFERARRHGVRRITIFDETASPVNDTASGEPSAKRLPHKEDILSALRGENKFSTAREDDRRLGIALGRLHAGGKTYAVSVTMELPAGAEGGASGVVAAIAAGAILFVILLYTTLRVYGREHKREAAAAGETSEVGFVVDTFHGLVSALKEKEKELEALRGLAEERADAIEGYNENILQSVTSGVISINGSNRVTKINAAGGKMLEINPDEAVGRDISEVLTGRTAELILGKETIERGETLYIPPSGRRLWLGFNLAPLLDKDEKPIGKLFVFTDLTELKALEAQAELRQRLSSLGEMAAGIAHELRNPMAVIAGYAKLLSRQLEGKPLKTIEAISKEVSVMDKIITDFLSFAKPVELHKSDVNLHGLIAEIAEGLIGERTDIELSLDMDMSLTAEGDDVLLRQVFTNLIQNSIEAMPEGGGITVSGRREGEVLYITFSDTGHGIPDSVRDKIFLPFFTTKERGTGLGLAIVHRTIAQHGGFIEIEKTEKGAKFAIALPAKKL